MKHPALPLLALIGALLAAPASAVTLYVNDESGNVGTVDSTTGAYTQIGKTLGVDSFVTLSDIALSPGGELFGVTEPDPDSTLVRISTTNAAVTPVGDTGVPLRGLGFRSDGVLFAAGASSVYTLSTTTGMPTFVHDAPAGLSADDLAFDASGRLQVLVNKFTAPLITTLVRIDDPAVPGFTSLPTGRQLVHALALGADGLVYGIDYQTNRVITFDLNSGLGTLGAEVVQTAGVPSGIVGATAPPGGVTTTTSSSATTTTTLGGAERCDNCIDDDGNGLTDFEQPHCCGTTGTIKMRRANMRLRGATGLLNLETQVSGLTGVDPLAQNLHVLLRHENGTLIFCGTMPAANFKKRLKFFNFRDRKNTVPSAAGVDGVVVRLLRTKRYQLHVQGKRALLHSPAAGKIRTVVAWRDPATAEAGNRCATVESSMRTAGNRKSVRFP
jgi:hypothetical protein